MKSNYLALAISLLVSPATFAQDKSPSLKFEKEIQAYEAADAKSPPPKNAILFAGASGIRLWTTLAKDFPDQKVINRGFGGSQIADNIYYAERLIFPHQPRIIVFQAAGNDLNAGKSPEEVAADFQKFVEKVREKLPSVKIVFMSIQPSPKRWEQAAKQKETNQRIEKYIGGQRSVYYLNAWDAFLNSEGQPREELFVADRLHHNEAGYQVRVSVTKPFLEKVDLRGG